MINKLHIPAGITTRDWRRSPRPQETRSRLDRVIGLHGLSARIS
jgi:hypothetical protein